MKRRLLHKLDNGFPDFSQFGMTRLFAFFKPNQATIDYALKIYDSVGDRTLYVFFDDNKEISLDSPLSTTTTPTSEVLGDLVIGSVNIEATSIFCLISGVEATRTAFGAYLVLNGVLCTRNGRVCLRIPDATVGGFVAPAFTELNNSFTSLAKHYNADTLNFSWGAIIQASATTFATYRHWRPTDSSGTILSYRGGTTTYELNPTTTAFAQSLNTIGAVEKNVEMTFYQNGLFVDSIAISGNLSNNTNFVIAKRYAESDGFYGDIQLVAISTQVFDATKAFNFNKIINNYFQ